MITPNLEKSGGSEPSADSEHYLPLAALSIDGTPPEVGDTVEYTVRGTIALIDGATAYVKPETINDQPVATEADPAEPDNDDMMDAARRADAEDAPTSY